MRVDKFLSANGFGTRKEVKKIIKAQRVSVNQAVIKNSSYQLPIKAIIQVDGKIIERRDKIYLMMNKPAGYVCTNDDVNPSVLTLITAYYRKDLFCVGRLDKDTTGLLLITNDGSWAHKIIKPNKNIIKVYKALITNKITAQDVELFANGVIIDTDYKCKPAKLSLLETYADTSLVEVVITEGKHHQVKKMIRAINQEVLALTRVQIGNLELDLSLELRAYRLLTADELQTIF